MSSESFVFAECDDIQGKAMMCDKHFSRDGVCNASSNCVSLTPVSRGAFDVNVTTPAGSHKETGCAANGLLTDDTWEVKCASGTAVRKEADKVYVSGISK